VALVLIVLVMSIPLLPQETTPPQTVPPKVAPIKLKSESTAFVLSFLGVLIPMATCVAVGVPMDSRPWSFEQVAFGAAFFFGALPGPSLGYFYGGVPGRGWLGIGIRSACLLTWVLGGRITPAIGYAGFGAMIVSTVWDVAVVGSCVHKHNLELQRQSFAIAPVVFPDKKGIGAGFQLRITF
jgi:hypothetical protein